MYLIIFMLAMLLHRLISTVYLNRAYIYCLADRAYIRYRTGIKICTQGCGICRIQQLKKYRKWKIRECQRLRCEVQFEENKLLLLLLLLLCVYECSALRKVRRRGSIEDTGRVVQCVRRCGACCAVCVWLDHSPQSPR